MRPDISQIIEVAAAKFHITPHDVLSNHRTLPAVYVRQLCYWLAHELTLLSYPAIGREMNRDHSAAVSGTDAVEARRLSDPEMQRHLDELMKLLGDNKPTMTSLVSDLHHSPAKDMISAMQEAILLTGGIWMPPKDGYGDHQFTIQLFKQTAFGTDAEDACRNWLRAAQSFIRAAA